MTARRRALERLGMELRARGEDLAREAREFSPGRRRCRRPRRSCASSDTFASPARMGVVVPRRRFLRPVSAIPSASSARWRRTRATARLRAALAAVLLGLVVAGGATRAPAQTSTPSRLLPPGTSGIVVIDVSRSVDGETYQPIASVLRQLIALREPVGVVAFWIGPTSCCRRARRRASFGRRCASSRPSRVVWRRARGAPPSQPVHGSPPGLTRRARSSTAASTSGTAPCSSSAICQTAQTCAIADMTEVIIEYRKAGIPLRIAGVEPQPQNRRLFERLVGKDALLMS